MWRHVASPVRFLFLCSIGNVVGMSKSVLHLLEERICNLCHGSLDGEMTDNCILQIQFSVTAVIIKISITFQAILFSF
jgi:hypothetical protein